MSTLDPMNSISNSNHVSDGSSLLLPNRFEIFQPITAIAFRKLRILETNCLRKEAALREYNLVAIQMTSEAAIKVPFHWRSIVIPMEILTLTNQSDNYAGGHGGPFVISEEAPEKYLASWYVPSESILIDN